MNKSVIVKAHPSLALIKYWGKKDAEDNLPATSSLALNLSSLTTETKVSFTQNSDKVIIEGMEAPASRYASFFSRLRKSLNTDEFFLAESRNDFPTAAGIASSSSGFAALTLGCMALLQQDPDLNEASDLSRFGSASAARSIFGGLTVLPKHSPFAHELFPSSHWPELRVLVAIVNQGPKSTSSRIAMERSRQTSPYYSQWVDTSETYFNEAVEACREKNIQLLGKAMQKSYLGMFATMWTSVPPVMYWEPQSLAIIKTCEMLRAEGLQVWETMDAGPQVKMLCLDSELQSIQDALQSSHPEVTFISAEQADGARVIHRETRT